MCHVEPCVGCEAEHSALVFREVFNGLNLLILKDLGQFLFNKETGEPPTLPFLKRLDEQSGVGVNCEGALCNRLLAYAAGAQERVRMGVVWSAVIGICGKVHFVCD